MNVETVITLDEGHQKSLGEGIEYNLRGMKTYNLFKRIIWSCVLDKPPKKSKRRGMINLPLLRGLMTEIRSELYVENYLQKAGFRGNDPSFKEVDIFSEEGYADYTEREEHEDIQDVLNQFSFISPSTYR